MKRIKLTDRLRYAFDNTMAKGTAALIGWLALATCVFVLIVSFVIFITGLTIAPNRPDGMSFAQIAWMGLMHAFNPAILAAETGSTPYLTSLLVLAIGGILLMSTLIGLITSGVREKALDLRKGRSFVVEQNHTIILGWSPQIFTVLAELIQANSNQSRACIVILADKDTVEMEDEIRAHVKNKGHTRIVCRNGHTLDPVDLEIANPQSAKSIIILSPPVRDPDTLVIKTILALTNSPSRKQEAYHIVAEIREQKNMGVARMVGRDEVELVLVSDLISRITVQTCRQSGLSVVYTELLNFAGDEIYFKDEPTLAGKTFGEALLAYEDSAVLGIRRSGGETLLNPPADTRIKVGDKIIAISADDDTVKRSDLDSYGIDPKAIQEPVPVPASPERTLILGWNARAPDILTELDRYVAAGSETAVVARSPEARLRINALSLKNQTVTFREGNTADRAVLEVLDAPSFQHIIVLSYPDMDIQDADSTTLITLLHLREMGERLSKPFSIVSEMLDVRNRELAEVTRADDFIVSDHLASLMLSQVSENKNLAAVFGAISDPDGSEIYLRPAEEYVKPGIPVNFYTVVDAARCRDQVALGYRLHRAAHDAQQAYGVVVNPDKSNKVTFEAGDKVILLAES